MFCDFSCTLRFTRECLFTVLERPYTFFIIQSERAERRQPRTQTEGETWSVPKHEFLSRNINPIKHAHSIREFCAQHGISRSLLYKLLQDGNGPRVMKAGKRTLITNEAAEQWRRSRERAA